MRGKDFNAGLRGGLFEDRHFTRMGSAVWLYGWLVLRQTHQSNSIGWVLGGSPVTYREIEGETGFKCRTLERWMRTLRQNGYIETDAVPGGVKIRITKAKKFPQTGRNPAGRVRGFEGSGTQSSVAVAGKLVSGEEVADRIDSSSVERIREKELQREIHRIIHRDFHIQHQHQKAKLFGSSENHTQQTNPKRNWQRTERQTEQRNYQHALRLVRQLLRRERDEEVRRELHVGAGPEPEDYR